MNPNEPKNKLTPLAGAKIPVPPPMPGEQERRLAQEIAQLAQTETNTLAVLAHGIRAIAESSEVQVALLQDIRDLLVKVCQATSMPLPARLQKAIEKNEYNPDEEEEDEGEEGEEDEDGDGDVLAKIP